MRLALPTLLTACLLAAGCGGLRTSPAWEKVISTRVDTRDAADPSAAYAEQISGVLKSANVEHKVITYEFHYRTKLHEDAIETRTSVLYRDPGSSRNAWWLADEQARDPVWVPGSDLDRQLEFYLHRPATVLSVDGHPAGGEAKRQLAQAESDRPSFFARLWPVRKTERSRKFTAPLQPVPASRVSERQLALFRARHGTDFDPASVVDRVKMERLTHEHGSVAVR